MNAYFENILPDYSSAEITCLFLHDRQKGKYFNLLTLIELVPYEQQHSPLLGKRDHRFLDRESVNRDFNIFIARSVGLAVDEAIQIFEKAQQGYTLKYDDILEAPIEIPEGGFLEREPAGPYPLLINKDSEDTIGPILPHRNSDFRVWTMLDRGKKLIENLDGKIKKQVLRKSSMLTIKHLGFDLSLFDEHWCNVYLFGCNPFIRKYSMSLLNLDCQLHINFLERAGRSISGCRIVLQDKRADNWGFHLEHLLNGPKLSLELPNFPNVLFTTIFDSNGYPLERSSCVWSNFNFNVLVQGATLNMTTRDGKITAVPKYSDAGTTVTGDYDHSLAIYFKEHLRKRKIVSSKANKEFAFFPGSIADKEEARAYISEIINTSSARCILLDTYFDEQALFYAYVISKLSVPIFILSSAFFLRKKIEPGSEMSRTHGQLLLEKLKEFRTKLPGQTVECRVLGGSSGSQLHDRYVVSDDNVYLLGSSFNEFGTRATTIFKVPAPQTMIAKADEWWNESIELSVFIASISTATDES